MPNADGSVIIKTRVDVNQAEKDLERLKKDIEKTENELQDLTAERDKAKKGSIFSAAELDAEKRKLYELKKQLEEIRAASKDKTLSVSAREEAKYNITEQKAAVAEQQERVRLLQSEYNKIANSVDRYDSKIEKTTKKLNKQVSDAGELARRLSSVSKFSVKMSEAQERAEKSMKTFGARLGSVVRSALVFTLITQTLAKLRNWIGKVLETNDEARASISRLKGALLTLAQPLVNVIIPGLIVLIDALTKIVLILADLFARLTGSTLEQSKESAEALNKETEALNGVGSAAKDAGKQLASFDEINQLSGNNGNSSISPSFDFSEGNMSENANSVAGAIAAIGAAFLTWKISDSVLGWFDKLGGGKFNNAHKVSAGLSSIAASFALMSWHYNELTTGELDPNSIKSAIVSAVEAALFAIGGATLMSVVGVGFGAGLIITMPIAISLTKLLVELSDEQGQAAVNNFKRVLQGVFSGEDWGTITKDFIFGPEQEKTFWQKLSGVFSGNSLHNKLQENLISVFKNIGSEKYGETLNVSVGDRIKTWMSDTFPGFFGTKDAETEVGKSIFTMLYKASSPLTRWLVELFENPISKFLTGDLNTAWEEGWTQIGETIKTALINAVNVAIRTINGGIEKLNKIPGVDIKTIPEIQLPGSTVAGGYAPPKSLPSPSLSYEELMQKFFPAGGFGSVPQGSSDGETITVVVNLDGKEVARNQVVHLKNLERAFGQ